jgi:hypothetical protein
MLTTGQTLASNIDIQNKTVTVGVQSGAVFAVDETILIDSERMLIVDIAANNLTVIRAWDGTTIAAHTSGATIYAPRTLTVERAVLGSTAATHSSGATVNRWDPPAPVRQLVIGETISTLISERAGYSRTLRSNDSGTERGRDIRGIAILREHVYASHGRKARKRAV